MKKAAVVFRSFEAAERAEKEYYRSLSPGERLEILLELNRRFYPTVDDQPSERPARVYRVTELE